MRNSAIVAHTRDDANKIFDDKIKYAWDRLPEWLRARWQVDVDNTQMLKFKQADREAYIYTGTGLRGGTNQNLLITELGTLDQKFPEKSQEIKSGALNTVHKGQVVVIESTAKGSYGVFYDIVKNARAILKEGKGLSLMDWKFFFFSWFDEPEYQLDVPFIIPREQREYFDHLEVETGVKLTHAQKTWYCKKKEVQKEAMFSEFPSVPDEAFKAATEGTYYGKYIDKLWEKRQITKVPYDPRLPVDTVWDLGIGDAMAITFVQIFGFEIRIIDYYENSGEGIPHYIRVLKERGYVYRSHHAPHDIEVRELTTGISRKETAAKLGIHFVLVPNIPRDDGIDAVRNILPKCYFDEVNTKQLIDSLTAYRKEWDAKAGMFKDTPLHDWSSNAADSFRYLAVSINHLAPAINSKEPLEDPEVIEMRREKNNRPMDEFNPFPEF